MLYNEKLSINYSRAFLALILMIYDMIMIEVTNMNDQYQNVIMDQMAIPKRLFNHYKKLLISEQELAVILHIHRFSHEGDHFPTPAKISEFMTIDEQKCSELLRQLIQKGLLTIVEFETESEIVNEQYSLDPLWMKIYQDEPVKKDPDQDKENLMNIFALFEQEFGRALSPFEIEMINIWLDEEKMEPNLIKAALRETVLMSKLNFRYIDRILREWKRKGIKTDEQARQQTKSFHANKSQPTEVKKEKRDPAIYYNWLEEND